MAIVTFPRPGWLPSPHLKLRRGHWSTQGLQLCVFGGQGNGPAMNYARQFSGPGAISGAVGNLRWGPFGARFTSEGDGIKFPLATVAISPTQRITVLFVRKKADTTLRTGITFSNNTATVNERVRATCPFSDGVVYWDFGGNAAPNRLSQSGLTFTTASESWAFVAGSRGSSIWRNGLLVTSQATAVTSVASTSDFYVNGGGIGDGDQQDLSFVAMLDAEWWASQIAEWHANPFLMFEQAARPAMALVTSAGDFSPFLVGYD